MGIQQARSWYRRQAAPVTIGIIASMLVLAFVWWFSAGKGMEQIILTPGWQSQPWTLFTYPWAELPFTSGFGVIGFLFLIMWMFWVGGSTERDLGPTKYLALWLAMILLPALFIVLLGPLVSRMYGAAGMWLPVAGITTVWCTRNPTQTIMLATLLPAPRRGLKYTASESVGKRMDLIASMLGDALLLDELTWGATVERVARVRAEMRKGRSAADATASVDSLMGPEPRAVPLNGAGDWPLEEACNYDRRR